MLNQTKDLLVGLEAPVFLGYASTGTKVPYVVLRPMLIDTDAISISGQTIDYNSQLGAYCVGGSVEASYNLAVIVMATLAGARIGGSTIVCSMGYAGALVEGAYEAQVTIQTNQGVIA